MNDVLFSELQAKEMLLAMAITRLIPERSENTFAILAAQGSAIERTRHSTISELMRIKSD